VVPLGKDLCRVFLRESSRRQVVKNRIAEELKDKVKVSDFNNEVSALGSCYRYVQITRLLLYRYKEAEASFSYCIIRTSRPRYSFKGVGVLLSVFINSPCYSC